MAWDYLPSDLCSRAIVTSRVKWPDDFGFDSRRVAGGCELLLLILSEGLVHSHRHYDCKKAKFGFISDRTKLGLAVCVLEAEEHFFGVDDVQEILDVLRIESDSELVSV